MPSSLKSHKALGILEYPGFWSLSGSCVQQRQVVEPSRRECRIRECLVSSTPREQAPGPHCCRLLEQLVDRLRLTSLPAAGGGDGKRARGWETVPEGGSGATTHPPHLCALCFCSFLRKHCTDPSSTFSHSKQPGGVDQSEQPEPGWGGNIVHSWMEKVLLGHPLGGGVWRKELGGCVRCSRG